MQRGLTLELVFHPEALAFDDDGVRMMQQPIQDCGGQGAVMVEDRGPLLKSTVGGNDDRPLFIAQADHLEEQVGARLVNGERLILDSRVVIGQFWCNMLSLQAFPEGRDRGGIFGKSLLISST